MPCIDIDMQVFAAMAATPPRVGFVGFDPTASPCPFPAQPPATASPEVDAAAHSPAAAPVAACLRRGGMAVAVAMEG